MNGDVSVIIPHYNSIDTLIRAIGSVLVQTLIPKEIIVCDDGSQNARSVLEILSQSLKHHKNFELLTVILIENNQGVSYARNLAVKSATGTFIAFLDCDDIWHTQKLELQYQLMTTKNMDFSCHNYLLNLSLEVNQGFNNIINSQTSYKKIIKSTFIITNPIATPTVMVRRSKFLLFDTKLRRMEDYECWVRNSARMSIYKLDLALAGGFKPAIGHSGLSGNVVKMHESMLIALKNLHAKKAINLLFFLCAYAIETIKYPIRLLKVKF